MPAVLTIHEAATTSGWSARMLRYVEQLGLVASGRSAAGYRLYGPAQLQRLRTLRELLDRHDLELAQVGFALRLRAEPAVAAALDDWFQTAARAPEGLADSDWLAFEQAKHEQLLHPAPVPATGPTAPPSPPLQRADR